jgi:hypothetical protein
MRAGVILALSLSAALAFPAIADQPDRILDSRNADQILQPGDVVLKLAAEHTKITQKAIRGAQTATREVSGLFHKEIRKGDPRAFHAALYLGGGRFAEASGAAKAVTVRGVDAHAGYLFRIYRPKDAALKKGAVDVGRRWANGRMKYQLPALVPVQNVSFGPFAKREALALGKDAARAGGPKGTEAMFCSQFVIAAYQAAAVSSQLAKKPGLSASDVSLPTALQLHASHASPLAFHAAIERAIAKGEWTYAGEALVRP